MTDNVSCNDMEPFQNPNCVPLEELKLLVKTGGIVKLIPALHEKWADKRYILRYEAPKIYNNDGSEIVGAKEHWMEIIHYIIDDLKWLLSLPFYRFWSNILHNSSILDTLVSFLQEAPPFFALEHFPHIPEMLEVLDTLSHHVLVTFARLVTNKESPKEYMSSTFLGDLLYDNYIFTVPIIYDLCQLYGRDNPETIKRILISLFKLQPQYNDDLQKSLPCFIEALENVEQKFGKGSDFINSEMMFLPKKTETKQMTLNELEDIILYVLDISSNITVLLKNYPPATKLYYQEEFMNKIVSVYGNTIPEMYERLDELAFDDENIGKYTELKHCLDVSRVEILQLYRTIIYSPILNICECLDKLGETELKEQVDNYLTLLMSNAIPEKEFIIDYDSFFPIQIDLDYLSNVCPEIDTFKCDYIIQSIYAIIGNNNSQRRAISNNAVSQAGPSGVPSKPLTESNHVEAFQRSEEKPIKMGSVELASLITEVKDILSHLGEGFIEVCLKHYNYDSASVINAILEDTLPPSLKKLDFTLSHVPPDQNLPVAESLISGVERLNVFDNQEFDVTIGENTEAHKVHKGKRKDKYRNANELLNDKTDIKNAHDIYSKYSLVADNYDDEYDDTYDSHDVRGFVQDDSTESDSRPFTTPRILRPVNKNEAVSEDESDNEEENSNQQNGRDNFVQNPEELRARAEQRRLARRGGKSSFGGNHNVVGNAKGKGQEKDVLVNRQKKNTHKATQANHNRRSGAQWKRRQGMVPS